MARVVLVTGAGRYLGERIAARLSAEDSVERLIGVDTVPPRPGQLGRAEFVRADIRNPLIAKVLDQAHVDTVVHAGVLQPNAQVARANRPDEQVAGASSLLRACERSRTVSRLVVASTTAVYGSSRRDPAVFGETTRPVVELPFGYSRNAAEIEAQVRSFARRRDDITVSVLRMAALVGPGIDSWLTRYLALPVIPTSLGYDPCLQVLHESDAVDVLHRLSVERHPGVTNVAGAGVVTVSQAVRWAGRVRVPMLARALRTLRPAGALIDDVNLLSYGRVVDTTRLTNQIGFVPRYSTAAALHDYLDSRRPSPHLATAAVVGLQRAVTYRPDLT